MRCSMIATVLAAVVGITAAGAATGSAPASAVAGTPTAEAAGTGRATAPSLQQMSDIQSGRWKPKNLYVNEMFVRNSFEHPMVLDESHSFLDGGQWVTPPPKVIQPGETVKIQAANTKTGKGFKMGFAYEKSHEAGTPFARIGAENRALKNNTYSSWTMDGVAIAAGDGWGRTWIPRSTQGSERDSVDSDVFGKSNWSVTTWELAPLHQGAGKNLLRGKWSDQTCNAYRQVIKELKWEKEFQERIGDKTANWRTGLRGAEAGAYLGMLVNGCTL